MSKIIYKIAIISLIVIPLLISSCTEYTPNTNTIPKQLIHKKEFTNLMFDMRLAEVIIRQDITQNSGKKGDSITKRYYNFIFDKHGVSADQFQKSLDYYTNLPIEFDKINNIISDSLTKLKAEINNED